MRVLAWACVVTGLLLSNAVHAADTIITTAGNAFVTADATIVVGDTITWTALLPGHNVAESDIPGYGGTYNGSGFRSGAIGATDTFMQTFNTPGVYYYICEPHVGCCGMFGSITVLAAATPATSQTGLWLIFCAIAAVAITILIRFSLKTT